MNKIDNYLIKSLKKVTGNVLVFGDVSDKVINSIEKNDVVLELTLLSKKTSNSLGKGTSKEKKVLYNNIRKKFKKSKISTIVSCYDDLEKYRYQFISDSVVIAHSSIYLYIKSNEFNVDRIKKYYSHYNVIIEEEKCSDGVLLLINVDNKKYSKVKEKWYHIIDKIYDLYELISDLVIS